jgi:hypothetical protein
MVELYKREKLIGRYSSINSAKTIAYLHRGEERAQRFTIRKGRACWETMLPPKGQGRARWERVAA